MCTLQRQHTTKWTAEQKPDPGGQWQGTDEAQTPQPQH